MFVRIKCFIFCSSYDAVDRVVGFTYFIPDFKVFAQETLGLVRYVGEGAI